MSDDDDDDDTDDGPSDEDVRGALRSLRSGTEPSLDDVLTLLRAGSKYAVPLLPQAAIDCAATKKVPATARSASPCGDAAKLRVVITSSGADKILATYGLKGKSWNLCKMGTAV